MRSLTACAFAAAVGPCLTSAVLTCNLQNDGGVCNGKIDDTAVLQTALDSCAKHGVEVRLHSGSVCQSGPLTIPNNTQLILDEGAVLKARRHLWPADPLNNPPPNFLQASAVSNASIRGKGTIDGMGEEWWPKVFGLELHKRPWTVFFDEGSSDITLEDFTILNPPCWTLNLGGERYRVKGIKIKAPNWIKAPNTDGISVSARDVWISDVDVADGDDSIVMKNQAQNVLVENTVVRDGNGFVIGTSDRVDIHNITFRNCTAVDTTFGCHLKFKQRQTGSVSGILFEDIRIYQSKEAEQRRLKHFPADWAGYAIGLHMNNQGRRLSSMAAAPGVGAGSTTVTVSDVTFRRIEAQVIHSGEFLCNSGGLACRDFVFEHVHINASETGCVFENAFGSSNDVTPEECVLPSKSELAVV